MRARLPNSAVLDACKTLFSHWTRNPMQAATFVIGLAVATALFAGVQAINLQARASYADAAAQLGANELSSLAPKAGRWMDEATFSRLRRNGVRVSPVVEGAVRIGNARYSVIGVDLATLPRAAGGDVFNGLSPTDDANVAPADFLTPPYRTLIASSTAEALGVAAGDVIRLDTERRTPPVVITQGVSHGVFFTDIGAAQKMLNRKGEISRLLVDNTGSDLSAATASDIVGIDLTLIEPQATADISRLTRSFHLNLTAFGFLSFFVGLLIVHSAIGLAFDQRRAMIRTMRACGVSQGDLVLALLIELAAIAAPAGLIGLAIGYAVAALLLPDVALTLRSLYGAAVPGALTIKPWWWIGGLSISVIGALVASASSLWRAARLPVLAPAQP
ncbi:MAG: ABC transporter permease, partial [Pseudomonadota bacterium]